MTTDLARLIDVERTRLDHTTEDDLVRAVEDLPELPDSDDSLWDGEDPWYWLAGPIAAADVLGERGWRAPVKAIYERAALGDVFGYMQSIRHGPEKAYRDDLPAFSSMLLPLAAHPRPGTRQWAVRELGILRELNSLAVLVGAATDDVPDVREEAIMSIEMLAQRHLEAELALAGLV